MYKNEEIAVWCWPCMRKWILEAGAENWEGCGVGHPVRRCYMGFLLEENRYLKASLDVYDVVGMDEPLVSARVHSQSGQRHMPALFPTLKTLLGSGISPLTSKGSLRLSRLSIHPQTTHKSTAWPLGPAKNWCPFFWLAASLYGLCQPKVFLCCLSRYEFSYSTASISARSSIQHRIWWIVIIMSARSARLHCRVQKAWKICTLICIQ